MKSTVIVTAAIAIAGSLNLAYPFKGDQALFAVGAKMLASGGVLYRDLWDLKQPGIYWFYHAAGALFGYTQFGVHIAELVWFTALAMLTSASMRRRFVLSWTSDLCALLTVGVYFSVCGVWHLTQLEGIVSLPLFLCFLLAIPLAQHSDRTASRMFIFGMLVAVIALFKLMLVAIPITMLLIAVLPNLKALLRNLLLCVAGAAIVILPVIAYFGSQHQLLLLYKTFFVYPRLIIRDVPMNSLKVLLHGWRWFAFAAGPLMVFGFIGLIFQLGKPLNRFTLAILGWIVVAAVLVLVQRMWWEYHFLLVLFPLGILATIGVEEAILCLRAKNYSPSLTVILLMLAVGPFALRLIHKGVNVARHPGLENFRLYISPDYANATLEAKWITAPAHRNGDIYVMGDPLIILLSGRNQTIDLNGWSPEWFLPEQWDQLANEIQTKRPRYIFVAAYNQPLLHTRARTISHLLAQNYLPARKSDNGEWYILNGY